MSNSGAFPTAASERGDRLPDFAAATQYAEARVRSIPLTDWRALGVYRTPLEYYLIGTYPPLKYLHDIGADEVFSGISPAQNIYLHIPFCEQYCTFCHFHKEINSSTSRVGRYVDALRREIAMAGAAVAAGTPGGLCASSVYFGGGTPSYLSADQLGALASDLWRTVATTPDTEITFELHPGVVRQPDYADRLDAMVEGGVNRWVFGVQSMDEDVLRKLNRGHGRAEVYRLLEMLRDRGIDNVNVDLIFGLPRQNLRNWYDTIVELLGLGLTKFNIFPLMFKRSDPITRHYIREPEIFPDELDRLRMHFMAEYLLTAAEFTRGPVFYYAKGAVHSRQQERKFDAIEEDNLVGLGVSSFGYVGGTQYYNVCDTGRYLADVESGNSPVWRGHTLPAEERLRRSIMFGIRSGGVDLDHLERVFGVDGRQLFGPLLDRLAEQDLVDIDESRFTLTDLGCTVVDGIGHLFASDEVLAKVAEVNGTILTPAADPLDRYDYSPIGRIDVPGGIVDHYRDRAGR